MIDGNSNGIPDPLETNLNYTGGPFTIPGSNITINEPFDPRNILGSGCLQVLSTQVDHLKYLYLKMVFTIIKKVK